jgi:transcription initiation factor IIE alpha subunit
MESQDQSEEIRKLKKEIEALKSQLKNHRHDGHGFVMND